MPGTGHRQEFGKTFDNAQYQRLECDYQIHVPAVLSTKKNPGRREAVGALYQ
jgi:hypothetical protein